LCRQNLPTLAETAPAAGGGLRRGAYVVHRQENADLTLIATGSELALALEAVGELEKIDIRTRVVSMPSWELFARQSKAYRHQVLPHSGRYLVIEAGATFGWHRFLKGRGEIIGLDHFGASAPAPELFRHFRITRDEIIRRARALCTGSQG
jgi:transketolase